jgi:hypothetical protein
MEAKQSGGIWRHANGCVHIWVSRDRAVRHCPARVLYPGPPRHTRRSHRGLALRVRFHVTAAKPIRRIAIALPNRLHVEREQNIDENR